MLTILVLFGVNMLLLLLGSFMHNEFILGIRHFFVSAFSNNSISVLKIYIRHFACFRYYLACIPVAVRTK